MEREYYPVSLGKGLPHPGYRNKKPDPQPLPKPEDAVPIAPVLFTKAGEDVYPEGSADDARPIYSDFRPIPYPADAEVDLPGVDVTPKVLSVQESVDSSTSPVSTEQTHQENPVPEDDLPTVVTPTVPEPGPDAGKDNTEKQESETSMPSSSLILPTKIGKHPLPVRD